MAREYSLPSSAPAPELPLLLCFSHLRWSFVWQRPQQLMSRFAENYRVVFVEEPVMAADSFPDVFSKRESDGVTVLTPLLSRDHYSSDGYGADTNPAIRSLLRSWLTRNETGSQPVVWYWTPLALGACPPELASALVVFDAMDELSAFRFASENLVHQETSMMSWADLIFAGGPSLYRARCDRHSRVFCFPSGVDADHYRQAASGRSSNGMSTPGEALHLGYVGVLDERIDFELIAGVADLRPDWTISMVGPLAKIEPGDIPVRPNLEFRGMQPYEALPGFMATFDVGILPFANNEATRFISPTKTLEYLAAELPVVSTPVADVVELYGDCVATASGPEAFVAAIESILSASPREVRIRQSRAEAHLERHSWDAIVAAMHELIAGHGANADVPSQTLDLSPRATVSVGG